MGSGSESDTPVAPPKRSLFKKSEWAKPKETEEALNLFSRSKEMFLEVVAENERRRKKLERQRSSGSVSSAQATDQDAKKRRVSTEADEDTRGSSSDDELSRKHRCVSMSTLKLSKLT